MPIRFQSRSKVFEAGVENLQPARFHGSERRLTLDQMDRGPPLRSGFCEDQRPVVEFERGERYAPRGFLVPGEPAQPPGDHQVQHDEQGALELEHDTLAQAPKTPDLPSLRRGDRRAHAAKDERIEEPDAFQRPSGEAIVETFDIDDNVGQLRHRGSFT